MAGIEDIAQENILLSFFKRGYYKITGSATLTGMNGKGILVAENTIFGAGCDTGDGKQPPPASGEAWSAGFFHPMKAKDITITEGTIYIGRI